MKKIENMKEIFRNLLLKNCEFVYRNSKKNPYNQKRMGSKKITLKTLNELEMYLRSHAPTTGFSALNPRS
jgi:hypothetical protein